jgi:hypothetical protein
VWHRIDFHEFFIANAEMIMQQAHRLLPDASLAAPEIRCLRDGHAGDTPSQLSGRQNVMPLKDLL